jgi:uncharacterized protein YjbI with pentapeptide repeats
LEKSLLSKCEFYSCDFSGVKLHGSTLKDLVFSGCMVGSLEAINVTVVKSETESYDPELTAVLSGKIADLKWPADKRYGWRAGKTAIRF